MSRFHAHIGTVRQLEILLSVYDMGSVRRASEQLSLTQPTVSMQLKKLADAIGMPLYDIIGKRVVFTEAGHEVARAAREILANFSQLEMKLADLRGMRAGVLNLAVVTTSKYFIPHLLGPFCEQYPNVDVRMNVGNRQQIIERLHRGTDDFYVFSHLPDSSGINKIEFLANPLVAIAPENHPLAQCKRVTLKDICKDAFLMREAGSGTRYAIERFMQEAGVELNIRMTIESNEAIKHAVMSGLGLSILSAHTLLYGGNMGLAQLPVRELPIKTHWYFAWHQSKQLSVIARAFLEHVESGGKKMLEKELLKAVSKQMFS